MTPAHSSTPMRLPDFLIVGAMKSGTTSLHSWLDLQPECWLPAIKEPNFFSDEWERGLSWYGHLFAKAPPDRLTGEASVRYTGLHLSRIAAPRIRATVPDARLFYIVRHPLDRIRSQYRHFVTYRWTSETMVDLMTDPEGLLASRSLYFQCLSPYIERFPREQICVVRFEDLVFEPRSAWPVVLAHLGLQDRPAPGTSHNVGDELPRLPKWMAWLKRRGVLRPFRQWPRPIRHYGRRALGRILPGPGEDDARLIESSRAPIPPEISDAVWEDVTRLEAWLGVSKPLWER